MQALISEANGRGGLDNITAIIVQVLETDPQPDDPNRTLEIGPVG